MEVLLTDYKIKYGIDENDEILKSLDQRDYYTYKRICGLAIIVLLYHTKNGST